MKDLIIVGGGPAGMTAALYALRNGKSVLVLEKHGFGGQITYSPKVENWPGTLQMSGNEFADRMMDQILVQGAEVDLAEALCVEDRGDTKAVITDDGRTLEARAVVIAVGVKHRMLGLPGETDLVGEGVHFCAVCDGDFYAGKTVCMAGGGNSALQEAILLSGQCEKVIMLQDLPEFTGEKKLQQALFARPNVECHTGVRITALRTEAGTLTGVEIMPRFGGTAQFIPCDGLFEAIGLIPKNEAFRPLADLDERGYFSANEDCCTKTPGIFIAGDCRAKSVRQLTTAVADGAAAALAACRYLD